MADVIVFHHAQGLTDGVQRFADRLRSAGHRITVPDLYEGRTFDRIEDGVAHADELGFDTIADRGRAAADQLPPQVVYAGFSLGVVPAQMLVQTRPGATGALFFHACLPPSEYGLWPERVPVQVHAMDADPIFTQEGDIEAARSLVATALDADLFLYPGDRHLFADDSLPDYDEPAAALALERVLAFLARLPENEV